MHDARSLFVASVLGLGALAFLIWPGDRESESVFEAGEAILPDGPGLGIELDWDLIENCTFAVL